MIGRRIAADFPRHLGLIETCFVERCPYCPDAAIHHVARSNEICAGLSVRNRGLGDQFDTFVIQDMKMFAIDSGHTAVAVAHVFTKAHIGDYGQSWCALFDLADRVLHNATIGVGGARFFVFGFWNSKKENGL